MDLQVTDMNSYSDIKGLELLTPNCHSISRLSLPAFAKTSGEARRRPAAAFLPAVT